MALYQRNNAIGIDKHIDNINAALYAHVGWSNWDAYGRIYSNIKNRNDNRVTIPEAYTSNGDYKELFYDDKNDVISWFYFSDVTEDGYLFQSNINIIVCADLKKLYPSETDRADEKARDAVISYFRYRPFRTNIENIFINQPNVFADFDIPDDSYFNIQPRHCFRISLTTKYSYRCN